MNAAEIDEAVEEFDVARQRGEYFPRAWFDRLSIADAYRIQLGLISRQTQRNGRRRIGWKVGLTARAIQEQFRVGEPVFACLLDDGKVESGHRFRHADLIAPGVENELCVELARDIAPGAPPRDIAEAVAAIYPALEIIETRGDFTGQLALALADNAQQHAFVVGRPVRGLAAEALPRVTATVHVNGVEIGSGKGEAVLGHPYHSLAWLSGKLAEFGEKLTAGDFVMTGSFTRQFPLAAGDHVQTRFEGVGEVSASFV